jgi:HSP20 family protein
MRSELDEMFEDFFDWGKSGEELTTMEWSPSVDISENDDNIVVNAEIPGMNKEDINVSVRDDTLTIKGEKKREREEEEENYHVVERSYGRFQRSFTLPDNVKSDDIKANYKDGVLNITIPKTEEAKSKELKVDVS